MTVHRLKIEEITSDRELQELLKQLGNQDTVITKREIDSDKNDYFDVNAVTEKWPEYLFRRVEHALFSKRLIDSVDPHPPLLKITLNNPEQTPLNIRVFDAFDPQVEPGQTLDLRTMELGSLDAGVARLNLEASLQADNPGTPTNEGIENIARYLSEEYFPAHPEILTAFGVTDVRHLTPRQAVQLASYIPIERIEYSREQTQGIFLARGRRALFEAMEATERVLNDETPIEQLFRWDRDEDGNGVCRNYGTVARGVLDALKGLQDPATSQLNTTYALELGSEKDENVPGFVKYHAWNGYMTVTPEGVEATILDSTWADSSSLSQDPARLGGGDSKLDYTKERLLTLVNNLNEKGLVNPSSFSKELLAVYHNFPQAVFPMIDRYNVEAEFRSPPPAYSIGSQIVRILDGSPQLIENFQLQLPRFLRSYSQALQDHARQMEDAKYLLNRNAFDSFMLFPFLQNMEGFIDLCLNLPEKFEGKEEGLRIGAELLKKAHDDFGFGWVEQVYACLRMAEKINDAKMADQFIGLYDDVIKKHPVFYHHDWMKSIALIARSERWSVYKDRFGIDLELNQQSPAYREVAASFQYIGEDFDMKRDFSKKTLEDFYGLLAGVLRGLSGEDHTYLARFSLHVSATEEQSWFGPHNLCLLPSMTREGIIQEITDFIQFNRSWDLFRKNCPCEIEIDSILRPTYADQLMVVLEGAREYFSRVDLSLARYKRITFGNEDKTKKYLEPEISMQHFIDRDFETVDLLLKTHESTQYGEIVQRRDVQRKYRELERSPLIRGNIGLNVSDGELPLADAFYEPVAQALAELELELEKAHDHLTRRLFELTIRPRHSGDPGSGAIITQEGKATLFLDLTPEGAKEALVEAGKTYARFRSEIVRLQTQGDRDNYILFEPEYEWEELTTKTFARLLEVEKITRPLRDNPNSFLRFNDVRIFFDDNSLTVTMNVGGTDDRPDRQYKLRSTSRDSASFMRRVIPFMDKAKKIEDWASQFENDHGVSVFFWFDYEMSFDYLGRALDNAERFFSEPRPEYQGYTLQISPSNMHHFDEIAPFVFVSASDRTIDVKAGEK